jgi:hypothetical protein
MFPCRTKIVKSFKLIGRTPQASYAFPEYFAHELTTQALKMINVLHPNSTLHATVLEDNIASHTLFLNSTFKRLSEIQLIRDAIN